MRLYARQGANGNDYYIAEDKPEVWMELSGEFGISYAEAKKTYPLDELPVTICTRPSDE